LIDGFGDFFIKDKITGQTYMYYSI